MPSRLPGFDGALPAYGAIVSFPWAAHAIEVGALYGASDSFSVKIGQAGLRLNAETAHFSGYALVGAHVLGYSSLTVNARFFFGGFVGIGASLPMGKAFALDLGVKSYFQSRPMLSMGGAFRVSL